MTQFNSDLDPRRPLADLLTRWHGWISRPAAQRGPLTAALELTATPLGETHAVLCARWAGVALADGADTISRMGAGRPADWDCEEWEAMVSAGDSIARVCEVLGAEFSIACAIAQECGAPIPRCAAAHRGAADAAERARAEAMVGAAEWDEASPAS